MEESEWHAKVRKEIAVKYAPHVRPLPGHQLALNLYKDDASTKKMHTPNCLSDADLIIMDDDNQKVLKIIEIETSLNPKKIMGIVMATHICNFCQMYSLPRPLIDIELEIVFRKAAPGSKKDEKLGIIEPALKEYVRNNPGSIRSLEFTPHSR